MKTLFLSLFFASAALAQLSPISVPNAARLTTTTPVPGRPVLVEGGLVQGDGRGTGGWYIVTNISGTNIFVPAWIAQTGGLLTGASSLAQLQDLNWYPLARRQAGQVAVLTNGLQYQLAANLTTWIAVPIPGPTSTTLYGYGDSIMNGSAVPGGTPELRFLDVVGITNGWSINNLGYGGARIADIVWQTFPGFTYTNTGWTPTTVATTPTLTSEEMVFMTMAGYNDMRDYTPSTDYATHFRRALSSWVVWTTLAASEKRLAQSADIITGSWTNVGYFGGNMGVRSGTLTDSLTFSNVVGSSIYVCFMAHPSTNDNRTFSVLIDSTGYGSFQQGPAYGNRYYESGNIFQPLDIGPYTNGVINQVPWVIRFPGLSRTAHTVTLAVTGVTEGPVEILWVAGNGGTLYNTRKGPYAIVGNTLRSTPAGYGVGTDSSAGGFSVQSEQVVRQLQSDGLKVLYADANKFFDPYTEMSGDNVHPTVAGHASIAAAFQAALTPDIPQIASSQQPGARQQYYDGDLFTVQLPSTTGQYSRELKYRGGSLPFVEWDFLAPLVDGTFIEFSGTPASTTGSQRFLDIPLVISQSGTGGYVGLGVRVGEASTGSGSKFPFLVSTQPTNSSTFFNLRLQNDGDALVQGVDASGGQLWQWQGLESTNSQVIIKYADFLDRRIAISGNAISVTDSSSAVQSLALGNGGRVVVPGTADTSGLHLSSTVGPSWLYGTQSTPEGAVTASTGSFYSKTDGGDGTAIWIKELGASTTGWDQLAGISQINTWLTSMQTLGSSIKAVSVDPQIASGTLALGDGTARVFPVWIRSPGTITGAGFILGTQGNFTGDATNAIALYSYSSGTITKVAETANDEDIWKEAADTYAQWPFASPYAVTTPGLYFIVLVYNSSAQTTAPGIKYPPNVSVANGAFDLPSSRRILGHIASSSTLPDTQNMSTLGASAGSPMVTLY